MCLHGCLSLPWVTSTDCLGLKAVTVHDAVIPPLHHWTNWQFYSLLHTPVAGFSVPQFCAPPHPPICQTESQSCACGPIVAVRMIYSIWWVSYGVTCRNRSQAAQAITGWLSSKSKSKLPPGQRKVSKSLVLRNCLTLTVLQPFNIKSDQFQLIKTTPQSQWPDQYHHLGLTA